MMSRAQASAHAARMARLHGEPWLVFKTPSGAPCNSRPGNLYNTGRYATCRASERDIYAAGGAQFIEPEPGTSSTLLSVLS